MPTLTFSSGWAMGTLDWPGSGAAPVLASGVVTVPDGVDIALDVTVIESARRTDAQRGGVHITLTIQREDADGSAEPEGPRGFG